MIPTNYKIEKFEDSKWVRVLKDGVIDSICMNEESALHSIWVAEGKNPSEFYRVDALDRVFCFEN